MIRMVVLLLLALSSTEAHAQDRDTCRALAARMQTLAGVLSNAAEPSGRFAQPLDGETATARLAREKVAQIEGAVNKMMREYRDAVEDYAHELQRCAR